MIKRIKEKLVNLAPTHIAKAHCDGPCGVYDPAQARIEAEAVHSLTKKILDLKKPADDDKEANLKYQNTLTRYIAIKEQRADLAKDHILVLWTDYFKPEHLEKISRSTRSFLESGKTLLDLQTGSQPRTCE